MTWHLVKDALRRAGRRMAYGILTFAVWSFGDRFELSIATTFVLTMLFAASEPTGAIAHLFAREVRMMPVSNLEFWRARWWLAVVVPGVWGFAGKMSPRPPDTSPAA